jgi:pimeloyl-ACP methyl ester carboxylesterase
MTEATSRTGTKRATQSQEVDRFSVPVTSIHRVEADGVRMFYRAAGDANAPVILLLHGFPASSFMFRELIPRLANDYRVIAPDLPGFGFTEVPAERKYVYSFDQLALTIEAFTQALKLSRYAIYVFDYGAPIGFRLAMARPDRITAITGARGFAQSSTVQVDVLIPGKPRDFLREIIRLNSNRASDSGSAGIVVTVTAHVDEQDVLRPFRLQLFGQFNHLNSWHNAVNAIFPVTPETIGDEHDCSPDDHDLHRVSCSLKTTCNRREKITEQKPNDAIG